MPPSTANGTSGAASVPRSVRSSSRTTAVHRLSGGSVPSGAAVLSGASAGAGRDVDSSRAVSVFPVADSGMASTRRRSSGTLWGGSPATRWSRTAAGAAVSPSAPGSAT
nr:hypothetical protein [Streptomyces mutomycini]